MDKLEILKTELELFHKLEDNDCFCFTLKSVFRILDSKNILFADEIKIFCIQNQFETYFYHEPAIEKTKLFNFIDLLKEKIA